MVLRSDSTIPIARVVATRYAQAEPQLRFAYLAAAYRAVRPQRGHARELLQAGIELVGAPGPDGTAEALAVLGEALDATGLESYKIGLGDAALFPALLDSVDPPPAARAQILKELVTRDFVGLEREVRALDLPADKAERLIRVPQLRGGVEVLAQAGEHVGALRDVHSRLSAPLAARVIFDLGLQRTLSYYTGALFEVYDEALGQPLGGGGRYDDLIGRFGRDLPAVGWALSVEGLHLALYGERR